MTGNKSLLITIPQDPPLPGPSASFLLVYTSHAILSAITSAVRFPCIYSAPPHDIFDYRTQHHRTPPVFFDRATSFPLHAHSV